MDSGKPYDNKTKNAIVSIGFKNITLLRLYAFYFRGYSANEMDFG